MTSPLLYLPLLLDLTSDFTPRNAAAMAIASQWAYQKNPTIEGVLTNSQAILFDAGAAYVLAIRGTKELKDWITDGKFLLHTISQSPLKQVHQGFYDALQDLKGEVINCIRSLGLYDKPLFVCGHSLGGAEAELMADELTREMIFVKAVYTFGQPRVGNRVFAADYDANQKLGARTFRVVYENDIVPHVPLPGLLLKYFHSRTEVYLHDHFAGIPYLAFNRPVREKLWSDALMLFRAWRLCRSPFGLMEAVIKNHSIENYIGKLNSLP